VLIAIRPLDSIPDRPNFPTSYPLITDRHSLSTRNVVFEKVEQERGSLEWTLFPPPKGENRSSDMD
jgi:hypothetical protein